MEKKAVRNSLLMKLVLKEIINKNRIIVKMNIFYTTFANFLKKNEQIHSWI